MKHFFNRSNMTYFPLSERRNKIDITAAALSADALSPHSFINSPQLEEKLRPLATEIKKARERGSQVICAFGAHTIKNGLGPLLGEMLKQGWFTHLASNGAAVIHDWEFAWLGKSGEDVRENVALGRFGTWEETGLYINLALASGAYEGLGYAASVGAMILGGGINIPKREELLESVSIGIKSGNTEKAAAALDFYALIEDLKIPFGNMPIPHAFRKYSLLAASRELDKPFTCHPMFGHDIIYTHRANRGAAIGRTAERDFLEFTASVEGLDGGVYLSVGSAVMSPMIFEKALSMARNSAGKDAIQNCSIYVVDLQEASWDWSKGEPPIDNPCYYQRYMKTFNRMGCAAHYITADNRDFFSCLYKIMAYDT